MIGLGLGIGLGGGGSSSGAFDPASLPWAFLGKASSIAGVNGSSVASWTDSKGSGQAVVQATGVNQPTLVTSNTNFSGAQTVRFSGSQWLDLASLNFGPVGSPIFIWAVYRQTTSGLGLVVNLGGAAAVQFRQNASNVPEIIGTGVTSTDWGSATLNQTISAAALCAGVAGTGNQSVSVGNAAPIVGSATMLQMTATCELTIGSYSGGAFQLIGDIAAFGVGAFAPTAPQLAQLETYAKTLGAG